MSNPKLVLDTMILRKTDFLYWLGENYQGDVSVSPVAYMENKRQLHKNRLNVRKIDRILENAGITVGIFGKNEANIAAQLMSENIKVCECCHNIDWADTMIYSSIWNPPTVLVTDNVSDFPVNDRVMTPIMVVRRYGRGDDTQRLSN